MDKYGDGGGTRRRTKRQERKAKKEAARDALMKRFEQEDADTKNTAGDTTIPEFKSGGRVTLLNKISGLC
jgi:hypothetical protein